MPEPQSAAPVTDPTPAKLEDGMGLCLSGGGYRAMLFHLGTLWRLLEMGALARMDRISSVSGGSITAGALALAWKSLDPAERDARKSFVPLVVDPVRALAGTTIDVGSVLRGALLPGTVGDRIASAYDRILFDGATLQDLPEAPRFVINATNVQSGALWRFSRPFMGDWRVGRVASPALPLSKAVAASSAFPPVLSPTTLKLDPASFTPASGEDLQHEPFTSKVILTDGGVYDNLGLETVWKRYRTVLVSDAGGKSRAQGSPHHDWGRHAYRVLDLVDNQVRSLRKRQLFASYQAAPTDAMHRKGAYWGIRADISRYGVPALPCPFDRTQKLAQVATRLEKMPPLLQEQLINWGYAVCDAAWRRHVDAGASAAMSFPYPASRI